MKEPMMVNIVEEKDGLEGQDGQDGIGVEKLGLDGLSNLELQGRLRQQHERLLQYQKDLLLYDTISGSAINSLQASWNFTQGLVVGQLSVILVLAIFIKFFVFADSSTVPATSTSSKDISGVIVKKDKNSASGDESSGNDGTHSGGDMSTITTILEKTYYDVDNHAPESLDWFNVLIAQTIAQLRTEALLSENIYHSLNDFLDKLALPEYLGKIKLTEIDIGDDFPIFSNCRIKHSKGGSGRLEAKIDVDLSDTLTLGIETNLLLNHPRPLTAVLPVQLSVSIVRFSGCLTVSLVNTKDQELLNMHDISSDGPKGKPGRSGFLTTGHEDGSSVDQEPHEGANGSQNPYKAKLEDESTGTALMFSFSPDYRLEFTVKSLIGSRAKLQDVPKISALVESKLRAWFIERCIEPRFQVVKLPSLWPRRKNTRETISQGANGPSERTDE